MQAFELNPLADPRWDHFVEQHPHGSVFHSSGWLRALRDTYQYQPKWLTTSLPAAPLADGMLFCEVNSWLTGRRLVSLPFSDHCDPLITFSAEARGLVEYLRTMMVGGKYRYIEFRPSKTENCISESPDAASSGCFLFHVLSLNRPLGELFKKLHKDCIQRKVRRAEREGLTYLKGRTELLLKQFYLLMLRTRRRHSLPPQPFVWFRNLFNSLGDRLVVHVVYKSEQAVAASITLHFKDTVTYKYGCSDERFANLGGTPFMFWKIIEESKNEGVLQIDLGRTDIENSGLATFKERLGAEKQVLNYYRLSKSLSVRDPLKAGIAPLVQLAFPYIPDSVLVASGKLLYRHIG